MEMELEPKVKPLPYKIKGISREAPSQKALHVLDTDLRTHWSTGTNTKEWILFELDEPCLLSQIRIYNKSVLEWEIAVGLRYKPEAFVKVRPRCEAPRRDMMYPMNYTPCRYVRISCLRGNPIAIFFIELIGVSVTGLEPEFQSIVNHLLPQIIAHKQDAQNMHLQLLQDITNRLLSFLPQLEADLTSFSEAAESNTRFLAMLAGPLYPILHIVNEREAARASGAFLDSDASRSTQATTLTVSSNFEAQPKRSRSPSPFVQPASSSIVFRPDTVFMLLRRAYRDSHLGIVCRTASRVLQKLIDPGVSLEAPFPSSDLISSVSDETATTKASNHLLLADFSNLLGDEFRIADDQWDSNYLNVLDVGVVEEGILHVLYACASQPILCRKLAENCSEFWSILPLLQALLPALRPPVSSPIDNVDDSFLQWKGPFVRQALSQIVATSSSSVYRPLLHACAGYLASFSPSHAKAACVLIDMCSGPLAPWIPTIIAKVDLAIELLEELLGTIQGARHSITRARTALKYIILALSGHMDNVLARYKEVNHKVLFLVEMLEPFLDPAITAMKNTISFGDVSSVFAEKQEHNCALALNVIRTAVWKPAVLPSLESEWRRGSVAPSVLLSILGPHMPLPPEIDLCKCPDPKASDQEGFTDLSMSSVLRHGGMFTKPNSLEESEEKTEVFETSGKMDAFEDAGLLFAPPELKNIALRNLSNFLEGLGPDKNSTESSHIDHIQGRHLIEKDLHNQFKNGLVIDVGFSTEYFNLQADFLQLMNHRDCELRSSEFRRLALELHSQHDSTPEGHDTAIDALLLAAECYLNPFFMTAFRINPKIINQMDNSGIRKPHKYDFADLKKVCETKNNDLKMISLLERKRDITVLQILIEAAELDREYHRRVSNEGKCPYDSGENEQVLEISSEDKNTADAVTLVRQNQALLCKFLVQRLRREQHSMHEILMQSLLFLLHSGTEISCSFEDVIDIILGSAEYLNGLLSSFYHQLKEGNLKVDPERVHGVQRRWVILQKLVIASSTGGEGSDFTIDIHNGFQFRSLIPPSSWMQKIPKFSSSPYPLVRFLGWMAVSRYAKQYLKERLFLASDLAQLTCLLSIFADELSLVDDVGKYDAMKSRKSENRKDFWVSEGFELPDQSHGERYFQVIYPDLHKFFPNMKKQFEGFGEVILEAVGLQLGSLPSNAIPDVLCWFSDLCLCPFPDSEKNQNCTGRTSDHLKGYAAKNAKAIILYVLEAIIADHMEAMVPEIPRVVQVLVSLCRASYCDVTFLDSVMCLLKPLISYALRKMSDDEKFWMDDSSCSNFESLCFDELFGNLRCRNEYKDGTTERLYKGEMTIFILGVLFPDLSSSRKNEMLQSLVSWVDFTSFEPTSCFYDYLCAFQKVIGSCGFVLLQTLQGFGIPFSVDKHQVSTVSSSQVVDDNLEWSWFLNDVCDNSHPVKVSDLSDGTEDDLQIRKLHTLCTEEIDEFCRSVELLITKLYPTIDLCWKLHHQLANKLTLSTARCYMYSKCLPSIMQKDSTNADNGAENVIPSSSNYDSFHWRSGLEGIGGIVVSLQENHCWQVASIMLDYLLGLPQFFCLDDVLGTICSAIEHFCCHAPRMSWRLQTDKWLSILFTRGIGSPKEEAFLLVDLFRTMLSHPEPEQRSVALKNLGRVLGLDVNGEVAKLANNFLQNLVASNLVVSVPESVLSLLVSKTWDSVVLLASSDPSVLLRIQAMSLLVNYIPFAERARLQSLLGASDSVLHGLGKIAYSVCESPLIRLSLALLAGACLYSPIEDIGMIPPSVWRNLETLGMSNSGEKLGDMEKKACQALCKLRAEGDDAKMVLKEVLSSSPASKPEDPDFGSTRETILQVLANLTSVGTYYDIFSERIDKEAMELQEAEVELELLQKERAMQELSEELIKEKDKLPFQSSGMKDNGRLQHIKDDIRSVEKTRLREEIAARRQKKLLVRHARQRYLEEAASREMDLLQELDRERTSEVEREIERQRLLEVERAKTRELRHNLDMEKERQTQRDLQRELEQAESGVRPSRREFSSSGTTRSRDRYRDRENGRSGQEGSLRPSSSGRESGAMQPSGTVAGGLAVPTVVLGGSRQFSGQLPTILSSRDLSHERGSSYEDFDGSKDSGDTGSIGESDLASAFEGQPGSFGSSQRQGSRGSKSRQIMERREREGRHEGKWERKH